ncbi:MAG: oxidoreductase [Pseudomonadota bacterium]
MDWTASDIPDLDGKVAVVTGANGGIGYEIALALAAQRAQVIMACRDQAKADNARQAILAHYPAARLSIVPLDLSRQASVRTAAAAIRANQPRIDLLINNAGVMWLPEGRTEDGFETQTGTNHLGHFTLTNLLLPAMKAVDGSRIITVSSLGHLLYGLYLDNFTLEGIYNKQRAYSQSKIANLSFALELDRRLKASGARTISLASHPGGTNSELATDFARNSTLGLGYIIRGLWPMLTQSTAAGALPTLYAATAPGLAGGEYLGPRHGLVGAPARAHVRPLAASAETGRRLWELSERLTGTSFPGA